VRAVGRRFGPDPRLGRTLVVAQIAAALLFAGALLHAQDVRLPFTGEDTWEVRAVLSDAGGIPTGGRAPVLVSGVPSGRVEDVRVVDGRAVATLRLDEEARGRVRADARAVVEPRSALQDLTIDLRPGSRSAPALRAGATIPAARTRAAVPLDRVTEVLDADTRAQLSIVLGELAVAGRLRPGALRSALDRLRPAVDAGARVTRSLDERRALLTRLVGSVDRLAAATSARDDELARVLRSGRRTLRVTGRRAVQLDAAVGDLPATLAAVQGALRRTQALARPLDPALVRLLPTARALPGTLSALRRATPAIRGLLTDVRGLGEDGRAPARRLRRVLGQARPLARGLRDPVTRLDPIVRAIDEHKDGVGRLGERFSGVLSTNDANGPILRGLGFFEPFDPVNMGFGANLSGAALQRAKAQTVTTLTRVCLRENALACLVRYLVPGLPGSVRAAIPAARPRP
jgi:virulence factor Mce-like protein